MFRHFGALISLTILLVLVQAESSSLNCENLDAATCKQRFGDQLDQKVKKIHVETYKAILELIKKFYTGVLEDLPENSKFIEPIRNHLNDIDAAIPKLKEDMTSDTMIGILREVKSSYDPMRNFDDESKDEYYDILTKNNLIEFRTVKYIIKKQMHDKMIEAWKELFAQLRPVDLAAYSDYEKLSEDLENTNKYDSDEPWKEIGIFLDTPYISHVIPHIKLGPKYRF